jgi:hypothetical protein
MTVLSVSGSALDASFNNHLTTLKRFYKSGFEMFANTLLDEISILDLGAQEALAQLGLLIDASGYQLVSLTAKTQYSQNPPKIISECGYERMDLWGITWADYADDRTKNLVLQSMPEMAGKPVIAPVLEVLSMLVDNPVCLYDGLEFFHEGHLIDPHNASGDTAPNLITEPLTTEGWNTVLQTIIQRKAPGSKDSKRRLYLPNRNLNGSNLRIWTGHTGVFTELSKIFDPRSQWATATATETRVIYTQATIQLVPEMMMDEDADNYVYILVNNTPNRGVFARIPHPPKIRETKENSDVEVDQVVRNVNAKQTFGKTTSFPFSLYKWQFSS